MKYIRACIQVVLLLAVVVIPGLTVFASARSFGPSVPCKISTQQSYGENSAIPVTADCCDISYSSITSSSSVPVAFDDCCEVLSLAFGSAATVPVGEEDCCDEARFGAGAHGATLASYVRVDGEDCCEEEEPLLGAALHGATLAAFVQVDDPCAPVDGSCGITLPSDSVVGDMPTNEQAYWAPGKITTNVVINAGTYWVTGVGTADNGDKFYRILVACQYLWVPVDTMQPSYQAPWSGQPLPTTAVTT